MYKQERDPSRACDRVYPPIKKDTTR